MTATPIAMAPRRASPPLKAAADRLGPLADLAGTWVGSGFNLISLPDFDSRPPSTGPKAFRLKLNATRETLQFIPIGGPVPNRGSITDLGTGAGQSDIQLHGLTYLQRVSDAVTNDALHIEPGIWLNVPATTVLPVQPATVVRLGTIPHGDSMLAQGNSLTVAGGPLIGAIDSTPTGPGILPGYLDPFLNPPLPPGFKLPFVKNPNLALQEAIQGQDITNTVVLIISTSPSGGIVNIPFVVQNANATKLDAVFLIETVQQPDGSGTFMQLQYTQTVILNFLGIDWPHISVATLVKQ
ncbi:MAG: heme-binding protein [Stellaceae bacterium]